MKVVFVLDTLGLIGGTERHAAVAVPALVERGHEVVVLCREDQSPDFARGVAVEELPALGRPGLSRAERRELALRLRPHRPDVVFHSALRNVDAADVLHDVAPVVRYVHDHTLFCPGLNKYREDGETCREPMGFPCLRNYWLGAGCVCFKPAGHASPWLDPLRALRERWRELEVAKRSAHVLTNSEYMRGELLQVGFPPERTAVLYLFTGSNTPAQPPGPLPAETAAFLARGGGPLLFTPARLTLPDKGVDHLLTALGALRREFRAVIAGSGPAEGWLREKAREEGLAERVHFSGWTDAGAVETLYARADVVVCPSVWQEPFGLVGIEAMAHGKPVVAFAVGGVPEWNQDGVTGLCVPRRDTGAMAAAIARLLDDPAEARRLGEAGRRSVAERFPRERHLDRLEGFLRRAAG